MTISPASSPAETLGVMDVGPPGNLIEYPWLLLHVGQRGKSVNDIAVIIMTTAKRLILIEVFIFESFNWFGKDKTIGRPKALIFSD